MKKITFLLLCLMMGWQISAQFNENFDSGTSMPTGWSIINLGGDNGWTVGTGTDIAGGALSGANAARIVYNSSAHNDYLIMPRITVAANVNDQIDFWVKSRGTTFLEPYEVRLSTTTNTEDAFTVVLQASRTAPAAWTKNTVSLASYIGQSVYVAIKATGTNQFELYVDNVVNASAPTCLPPTALISTVSTHSATFSFTGSVSSPANGYQYELRTSGAAGSGATGLVASGADAQLSHTLNTLTPNTAYTYHVRAICSGTDNSAWESKTFTTLATAPANDNCFDAVSLSINSDLACTTTVNGTLLGATASGEGVTSVGTPDDDVWFKFVATGTAHRIVLSTVTPTTDLVHEVLAGDCGGGLYNIAISDPDTSNLTGLTIGTTYYVRVFSKAAASNATATFKICVGTPPPPPANDECSGAVLLTPSANLTCTSPTAGTTIASTQSLPGCVGTADDDVWYKFVATSTAHTIIVTNVSGNTDIVTEVFDSCGGTSLKCQDTPNSPITVGGLTIGTTYSFRIYTYSSSSTERTSFTVCVGTPPPPPANDNCSGAQLLVVSSNLTCTNPVSGTTISATQSLAGCSGTADDDVWYKFVATSTAHTIFTTNVSGVTDIVTQAFDSCGGTSLRCQDTPDSPVSLTNLTVGNTYFFRIYSYSSTDADRTSFTVCVGTPPPPPANDLIANASVLTESVDSSCANALAGTTVSASHSTEYACSTTDVDVWYTFTPATTGIYYFQRAVVSGTGNGYVSVYSGTPAALTRLNSSCSVNNFTQALTAGTQYYVSVSSTATTPLSFALCVFPAPPAPANDLIANAAVLTESTDSACGNAVAGTTVSATHSAEYACSATDVDVWYTFTPSATANYIFKRTTVSGTGNGYISIYSGASTALTRLNTGCTSTTFLQPLTAGTTYYVSVSSTATSSLTFALCVYQAPPAPVNDNCEGAITLTVNADQACGSVTAGTNAYATTSPQSATSLSGTPTQDVWFKFQATGTTHRISLTNIVAVGGTGSTSLDMGIGLYDGTGGCTDLVFKGTSDPETYNATGLVAGTTYYVRVYGWSATTLAQTTFNICIGSNPPPPANDLIANAAVLTESTTVTCNNALAGTTVSATHSAEYACSTTDVDVWYTFTPASTGNYIFSRAIVSGTGNGYISVYSGTSAALVRLNTGCFSTTFIQALTAGTTYYVSVSSTSGTPLSFNLCALLAPAAPANDLIENAAVLTESADSTCGNASAGTTISATHSTEYACSATDVDVWYTFTPASTGNYIFSRSVVSGTGNGYVSIYSGTAASLVRLNTSCTTSSFTQALTAGTTYYVSVSSTSTATLSFNLCAFLAPPAPSNDNCATPIALTAGDVFATNVIVATNMSATVQSSIANPTCAATDFSTVGKDVWFSVNAPASGTLTVETATNAGSALVDTAIQVYRGTCEALVSLGCNDDILSGSNIFSKLALTGLTAGEPLLVRVWSYGTTPAGTFKISAYDASLSTPVFDNASFKAYPNPVKDVLKLSYSQEMTNVSVFNLLGQEVISKSLNATEAQVDMSNLAAGTYLVKVNVDNQVKTIKVVKQ